ncbi:MAG: prolyl oligopeptidase family serine peptidase, partial [Gemmatimonadales bacterium]
VMAIVSAGAAMLAACAAEPPGGGRASELSAYAGRYQLEPDLVLDVYVDDGRLFLLPSFWRGAQVLDPVAPDTFVSLLHREIHVAFERDSAGGPAALQVWGHAGDEINGHATRLAEDDLRPVELLLRGEPDAALAALRDEGGLSTDRLAGLGLQLVQNFPSRAGAGARFLRRAAELVEPSADMYTAEAVGWMLDGRRDSATAAFSAAYRLAPDDWLVVDALRQLAPERTPAAPDSAWRLPFSLEDLFRPPTPAEIDAVRNEWATRDLAPHAVEEVAHHEFETPAMYADGAPLRYDVRIVSHEVEGDRHYGAILVPEGATPGCCGVVVSAHGVDPWYSGVDLEALDLPAVLGRNEARTIVVVPSFRGEQLRIAGATYESVGDPRRPWDGATDDALALLNVAIDMTPEADSSRICTFGKSRGGTVALLAAERDPRIDCVVAWAGPADWFSHMGTFGFTLQEQVEWGLWEHWMPGDGFGSAGQFIEQKLASSIAGEGRPLEDIRRQMIAGSPLYFVDDLPAAQLHYGREDRSVPARNAEALRRALAGRRQGPRFEVFVHEGSGHDQPYPEAYDRSREFLGQFME